MAVCVRHILAIVRTTYTWDKDCTVPGRQRFVKRVITMIRALCAFFASRVGSGTSPSRLLGMYVVIINALAVSGMLDLPVRRERVVVVKAGSF